MKHKPLFYKKFCEEKTNKFYEYAKKLKHKGVEKRYCPACTVLFVVLKLKDKVRNE